ncbi:MAG TPA: hypothetical protein ENI87_03010 [bacterium]|nr:hypothetical protein [bacterium]
MSKKRLLLASALAAAAFSSTSCTLAKPVVCAVTTPVYVLGNAGVWSCGCDDGYVLACGAAVFSVVGIVGGFVTGIISDINVLTGRCHDPIRNLHDPFATNCGGSSFR